VQQFALVFDSEEEEEKEEAAVPVEKVAMLEMRNSKE
jgi:hypothetical protein